MDVAGIEKQTSVGKALQLLEVLGRLANHEDIRLADIVRETGLQKPTAHRLLAEVPTVILPAFLVLWLGWSSKSDLGTES